MVLSSASSMRLTPPGKLSRLDTGFGEVLVEGTTIRLARSIVLSDPPQKPSGIKCWPTTYMVELATSALLAAPELRSILQAFTPPAVAQGVLRAALVGNCPELRPRR